MRHTLFACDCACITVLLVKVLTGKTVVVNLQYQLFLALEDAGQMQQI